LGRDAVLCLEWSTVPWLRTVGDEVEGHCGSRLEMPLDMHCRWAWFLEQETDNAVVLDILHLLLQIHPSTTSICSWPRGHTCCGPHPQAPLTLASSRIWPVGHREEIRRKKTEIRVFIPLMEVIAPVSWLSHKALYKYSFYYPSLNYPV